ncbi:MAG: Ribonuclease HI [Alphaproteobacteria bacterium MarineAlpha5_Bin11]|nr:MAG: Ribonuclease HI [Alphaproteobacteria bacterium MarineAlpha5_Bin11]PPR52212.1 MAG: Ribonuclease HI [Alphaproteobacteria bacterium MarineAlpha5_Bin10]|tara:strand:- start:672 stop:1103 length:432 start_codon:yes stop_codon:yes gene_type:complete
MTIEIYTDGACSGNPGIGGWGVVILINKKAIEIHGGENQTTNNQMELTAAIEGLRYFNEEETITLYTDSKYVKDGVSSWISKWKINGWKTANKKAVKNKELWQKLNNEIKKHNVIFKWIKGHAGEKYNERADQLARLFIEKKL